MRGKRIFKVNALCIEPGLGRGGSVPSTPGRWRWSVEGACGQPVASGTGRSYRECRRLTMAAQRCYLDRHRHQQVNLKHRI